MPSRRCAMRQSRERGPVRPAGSSPAINRRRRPGTTRLAASREVRRTILRQATYRGEEGPARDRRLHRRTRCPDSGARGASVARHTGRGRAPPPDRQVRRSPARGPGGRAGATAPDPIHGRSRRPDPGSTTRAWASLRPDVRGSRDTTLANLVDTTRRRRARWLGETSPAGTARRTRRAAEMRTALRSARCTSRGRPGSRRAP